MIVEDLKKLKGFSVNYLITISFLVVIMVLAINCTHKQSDTKVGSGIDEKADYLLPPPRSEGERLAQLHCGGCHLFPQPDLLEKQIWVDRVLPQMAYRLGVGDPNRHPTKKMAFHQKYVIDQANIFPESPRISIGDWEEIIAYYKEYAPEQLLHADTVTVNNLDLFEVKAKKGNSERLPVITMVRIDTIHRQLLIGDSYRYLSIYNTENEEVDKAVMHSSPVHCEMIGDSSLYVLSIGEMIPNDDTRGRLISIGYKKNALNGKQLKVVKKDLKRPVSFMLSDFNKDDRVDVFMCNFGYYTGSLSLLKNKGSGGLEEQFLNNNPGAIKVEGLDINGDGWQDILALMTQGDETLVAYINQQGKGFEKKILLRFPAVYGSSYFELTDWDNDQDMDIIYTNGDNADHTFSLKDFHGVRCFINQGNMEFKEEFFIPVNGATKSLSYDFDGDGDKDIAVIAYFADFSKTPEKGFVYLENEGNNKFVFRSFEGSDRGRWLTLDKGDADGDGDVDLLLGSFVYNPTPVPEAVREMWGKKGFEFVLLINKLNN